MTFTYKPDIDIFYVFDVGYPYTKNDVSRFDAFKSLSMNRTDMTTLSHICGSQKITTVTLSIFFAQCMLGCIPHQKKPKDL